MANELHTNRRLIGVLYISGAIFLAVALGSFLLLRIFLFAAAVGLFFSGLALLKNPAKPKKRFYQSRKNRSNGSERSER